MNTRLTLCKKCGINPRATGTRKSGNSYITSYCSDCTSIIAKDIRTHLDNLNKCMTCGGPRTSGQKRCADCALKLTIDVIRRYRNGKKAAVEYCGGACVDCGLLTEDIEVYDFHHLNPDEKVIGIGYILKKSWDKIVTELKKCILLCANCHRKREHLIDLEALRARCATLNFDVPAELTT